MEKSYEIATIVATIDPDAYSTGTQASDWIAMKDFKGGVDFLVLAGTLGSSAVLNCKVRQATAAAGTGAVDMSGKAITALTQAGTDSDKQAVIHVDPSDLSDGFTHVQALATLTVATSDYGLVALGFFPTYKPAADYDLSTVDEYVD